MKTSSMMLVLVATCFVAALSAAQKTDDPRIAQARQFFENYQRLDREFNPKAADLYADEAIIRVKRVYPTGDVRELVIPVQQLKATMSQTMTVAKARGDLSTYSEVTYTIEGTGVRIKADRYSEMKKYHSPHSILIKPNANGRWLIYEELGETRP